MARPFNAYNEKIARGIPINPPNAKIEYPHLLLGQMRDDEVPAVFRCPDVVRTNGMWDAEVAFDVASKSLSGIVGSDGDALFLVRITLEGSFDHIGGVTLLDTALTETVSTIDGKECVLYWAHLLLQIKKGTEFTVHGSQKPLQGKWDGRNLQWGWAPADRATIVPE